MKCLRCKCVLDYENEPLKFCDTCGNITGIEQEIACHQQEIEKLTEQLRVASSGRLPEPAPIKLAAIDSDKRDRIAFAMLLEMVHGKEISCHENIIKGTCADAFEWADAFLEARNA